MVIFGNYFENCGQIGQKYLPWISISVTLKTSSIQF